MISSLTMKRFVLLGIGIAGCAVLATPGFAQEAIGSGLITTGQAMTDGMKAPPSKIIMAVLAFLVLCCLAASWLITSAGIVEFQKTGEWGKIWTKIAGLLMMVCVSGFFGWLIYLEGSAGGLSGLIK